MKSDYFMIANLHFYRLDCWLNYADLTADVGGFNTTVSLEN
jgi:hypothetical protein